MTADECARIEGQIAQLITTINISQISTAERIKSLETLVTNERALCPYREDISRAVNNVAKIAIVEAKIDAVKVALHAMEITWAKAGIGAGAVGGGIFSAIGLIAFGVGKAAGWW